MHLYIYMYIYICTYIFPFPGGTEADGFRRMHRPFPQQVRMVYIGVCICVYVHVYVSVYICVYIRSIYIYSFSCGVAPDGFRRVHRPFPQQVRDVIYIGVCISCVCIYVCMCVCMYLYLLYIWRRYGGWIQMSASTIFTAGARCNLYRRLYFVCMYICVYVCMYVFISFVYLAALRRMDLDECIDHFHSRCARYIHDIYRCTYLRVYMLLYMCTYIYVCIYIYPCCPTEADGFRRVHRPFS